MKGPVVFVLVVIAIILVIDLYTFKAVRLLTENIEKRFLKQIIHIGYWLLTAVVISAGIILLFNFNYAEENRSYSVPFYGAAIVIIYLFPKLIFAIFHLVEDIGFLSYWGFKKITMEPGEGAEVIDRSTFLTQIGLGLAAAQASALIYGVAKGRYQFRVLKETITFDALPHAFDGLKVVQISDIHIGSFFNNHTPVKKAVKMINDLNADYILFTGDMVNNYAWELDGWIEILGELKAKYGKYSVLGNHDYADYVAWGSLEEKVKNLEEVKTKQKQMGFNLLLNEMVELERDGEKIHLLGMENWGKGRFSKYGDLKKTMSRSNDDVFQILMSHDPSHWDEQVLRKTKIDLALAGHTHGMQFGVEIAGIKWSPVKYRYPRWGGLYKENDQFLYVNRGFGYLGFPGRVGIPPEITLLELRKKT